jgi:hypothetical protein
MIVRRLSWVSALSVTFVVFGSPIRAADVDKYLPDDTQMVLHANIKEALDSALAKKYLLPQIESGLKSQQEAQEMLKALGLNPLEDVHSLTLAAPGNVNEKKWIVLLHGKFDLAKIQAAAEAFGQKQADTVKVRKQGDITIYELRDAKRSQSAFAAFPDTETLLISPTEDFVTATIAKTDAKKAPALNKNLADLIQQVGDKESLWLAALVPDQLTNSLPKDQQTLAKKVKSFKGGVTLTDGVQLSFRVQATDAKAARDVQQTLKGLQALLVLAVTSNESLKDFGPTLTDIVNSIKFTLDRSTVGMDLSISAKQIEEGFKNGGH